MNQNSYMICNRKIEHWIRVILNTDFIVELISMIIEFSKFHEKFDDKLSDKALIIEKDGLIGRSVIDPEWTRKWTWKTLIGIFVAKPGGKYEWKIKFIKGENICIGVLMNEAVEKGVKEYWWHEKQGYIWFTSSTGRQYCEPGSITYGVGGGFKQDDIITMSLDLNKYEISYMKNDEDLGVVRGRKIDKDKEYRLATSFYRSYAPNSVEIVSLDVHNY